MKITASPLSLACVLIPALALGACGKQSAEPEASAAAPAPIASTAASKTAAVAADPDLQTALDQTEDAELEINEPMPPLDESSAPPTVLARAMLKPLRAGVAVSGEVTLYQDPYGTRLLRIEDLQSPAGLAVDVAFSNEAEPSSTAGLLPVGALKGASGNMNYTIGSDVDLKSRRSLVLVVQGEAVPLAYCPLTPP